MNHTILAIDPGVSGGSTLWSNVVPSQGIFLPVPFSESTAIREVSGVIRRVHNPTVDVLAVIEFVHSSPQMGAKSAFTFGENYGYWQGLLVRAHNIPLRLVKPQAWQKGITGIRGLAPKDRKKALLEEARRRHPEIQALFGTQKVALAVCDSLLICDWAIEHLVRPRE